MRPGLRTCFFRRGVKTSRVKSALLIDDDPIVRRVLSQALRSAGKLPDRVYACVGGGSNAIGMFYPFIDDKQVRMIGVEAGGLGVHTGKHADEPANHTAKRW